MDGNSSKAVAVKANAVGPFVVCHCLSVGRSNASKAPERDGYVSGVNELPLVGR